MSEAPDHSRERGPWCAAVITCEHGGNRVPARYAPLFAGYRQLLATHRAYDPGALDLARRFATSLDAPSVTATTTRLLIDLNRSPGHPRLFSEITATVHPAVRQAIVRRYWTPYRRRVQSLIEEITALGGCVVHLSVHTFTPILGGSTRPADVGLLYDPSRPLEARFCMAWQRSIRRCRRSADGDNSIRRCRRSADGENTELQVRRNYPYRGTSDGLTTWLRRRLDPGQYAGIELEVNQRWHRTRGRGWQQLGRHLVGTFAACCQEDLPPLLADSTSEPIPPAH